MIPAFDTVIAIASRSGDSVGKSRASRRKLFEFIENRLFGYLENARGG